MFTERLESAAERLRRAAGNSRLLALPSCELAESELIGVRYGGFRRAVLREEETGVFPQLFLLARAWLFSRRLRVCGAFLAVWAAVSVSVSSVGRPFDLWSLRFWTPIAVFFASLPLCGSERSVANAMADDAITGWFFLRFCRFPRSLFEPTTQGGSISRAAYAGLVFGLLSGLTNPVWLPFALLLGAAVILGFAVPELTLIPMALGFPFSGLLPHPSLFFCGAALWSVLCWIPKALNGHREVHFTAMDGFVLLFSAVSAVGGMVNAGVSGGNGPLLSIDLLAAWFPVRTWLTSPLWRKRTVGCLLFSGSLCAGIGILQYALGLGEAKWMDLSRFGTLGGRVTSTFSNPNLLAVFLLVLFGFSLGGVLDRRRICAASLTLSAGCLIVTWSRGAWLGALAATAFCLLLYSRGSLAALMVSPLAILAVFPWMPNGVRARFASIGNLSETSSRYRVQTWKGVLRMIRAYPFGIGSGEENFHTVYPKFAVSGTESVMHAHNVFLQVAAEHGLVAVAVFLAMIFLLFRRFSTTRTANPAYFDRAPMLGCAAALVALLTMGLFDHLWYMPNLFWLFWFVAALLWAHTENAWADVRP